MGLQGAQTSRLLVAETSNLPKQWTGKLEISQIVFEGKLGLSMQKTRTFVFSD